MTETRAKTRRAEVRWPDKDTVYTINPDGSRNFMHPADVTGRWQVRKNLVYTVLIAIYMLLPWIQVGGYPAVHLDIPGRAAYILGQTFTNQDFYLVFFLLSGVGFTLFVLTSLWGRVWCGFACPQTVFLEGVYRKVERLIEGPRSKRIRRNLGGWNADKAWRKVLKHGVFIALSAVIAHSFVAYFIPAQELRRAIFEDPSAHWAAFLWSLFWTGTLYFNYSWFREQTCLIVCPYGRLQSSLIDQDSVIIGYDAERGEPRSKVNDDGGDCIDCHRCIQVCPTGIDIRNGLQLECLGCTNCIDACDDIMDKLERPRGLIRYDSGRSLAGGGRRSLFRPRVFMYVLLGLLGLTVATVAMTSRTAFAAKALRSRGMPYQIEDGRLRNLVNLRVQNKTNQPRTYFIEPMTEGDLVPEFIVPQTVIHVEPLADAQVPVFLYVPRDKYTTSFPVTFVVRDSATDHQITVTTKFIGP